MAYQMTWRVYGREGHRQRESFAKSYQHDFSENGKIRKLYVANADVTGTHEYTLIAIVRDSKEECMQEFEGQLSDGVFENSCVGKTELMFEGEFEA